MEFYKKNGKQLVGNGNGKFNDDCFISYDLLQPAQIKGNLKDGLMDGNWESDYSTQFYFPNSWTQRLIYYLNEKYENGKFVKGSHDITYTEGDFNQAQKPLISITNTNKTHTSPLINIIDKNKIEKFSYFNFRITIDKSLSIKYADKSKNEFNKFNIGATNYYSNENYFRNTLIKLPLYKREAKF